MAWHAKNPIHLGLLRKLWPFKRRRRPVLDRVGPATVYPKQRGAYDRVVEAAPVPYLPERPLLTPAGEFRAGLWS